MSEEKAKNYRQIRCNNGSCGRWLARVEGPTVYIYCPKCRQFHKESLSAFVEDHGKLLPSEEVVEGIKGMRFFG